MSIDDREAVQLLVNDMVLLAETTKKAIEAGHYTGDTAELAYSAMILCEQVLEKWTQKN